MVVSGTKLGMEGRWKGVVTSGCSYFVSIRGPVDLARKLAFQIKFLEVVGVQKLLCSIISSRQDLLTKILSFPIFVLKSNLTIKSVLSI